MSRVFPWIAVRQEVRERIAARNAKWAISPTAAYWVEDYYPEVWDRVKGCRLVYTPAESLTRYDKWKLVSKSSCRKVPWCIPCSLAKGQERLGKALDKISRATPEGQRKRVVPWTLVAQVADDHTGVGMAASSDINRFARTVAYFLHQVYDAKAGELGWIMSYQDFGERAFQKRHPHWHVTMNGYRWRDGTMTPIEQLNVRGQGHARITAAWDNALRTFFPGAKTGNLRAEQPAVGKGNYYGWVKYQVRELVDLRKVVYQRANNRVVWIPYREGVKRADFTGQEFRAGLEEYRGRVRPNEGNRVHRDCGYLEGGTLKKIAAAIGGEREAHDTASCPCDVCDEWMGQPELRPAAMGWSMEAGAPWEPRDAS